MNTGNFLGISQDYGLRDAFLRFQHWVGRQKVWSPEGTTEVQSHTPFFGRPFGTCVPGGMFPGVKTPGYSQDVPPGHRNVAAAFSAERATRFISDAFKGLAWPQCPASKMWDDHLGEKAPEARVGNILAVGGV